MTALVFGFLLVVIGTSCVAFGLITGAMPPFPSKMAMRISYRDEEPVLFWMDGGFYAALAVCGVYLVTTHWVSFLQSLA